MTWNRNTFIFSLWPSIYITAADFFTILFADNRKFIELLYLNYNKLFRIISYFIEFKFYIWVRKTINVVRYIILIKRIYIFFFHTISFIYTFDISSTPKINTPPSGMLAKAIQALTTFILVSISFQDIELYIQEIFSSEP